MGEQRTTKSRTKTLDATPLGGERFGFVARLTDKAAHGNFPGESVTIHDFGAEGVVEGPRLVLRELRVEAHTHPYDDCPFAIPPTAQLIGESVAAGWRRTVLAALGGSRGCTHVNTLLLGLSELTTMVIFLRINPEVAYTPDTRRDGRWTRAAARVAPGLSGACYGLRPDGPAMGRVLDRINDGVDETPPSL
ncbi:DUF2889 domain-containing protein [Dactylosporangium sp. NPDC005572]|uniref:DUF2889 domain-containing protein n=1 Tax=Dactylosporangium sp. NPDC005572 TaxID=3156889 RepID=UPI0033ACA3AE